MARPVALITGASSGIGEAFARRLARDGFDLVLAARRRAKLEELAAGLQSAFGVSSRIVEADLSLAAGIDLVEAAVGDGPAPEVFVGSAGFGTRGLFSEIEAETTQRMITLHVIANMRLARAVMPGMIERRRGRIIIVSSLGAFFTTSRYVTYASSKACLNMFCEGLRAELDGTGVSVQALCPGLTRTGFLSTPEYEGFDYGRVPSWMWMTAEAVVDESLASGDLVCIPGFHNRLFVGAMRAPVLGALLGRALSRIDRGSRTLF
jgi:short-subunit dehydrogenase